jgi:protein O-GlcNAc transferase
LLDIQITPEIFAAWMEILRRVPNGVLWLLDGNGSSHTQMQTHTFLPPIHSLFLPLVGSPAEAKIRILASAQMASVDPKRVIFAPFVQTAEENYHRLMLADVALDPTIWSGHTTSVDVLWMGFPLVSCFGSCDDDRIHRERSEIMASRIASSLLVGMGINDTLVKYGES